MPFNDTDGAIVAENRPVDSFLGRSLDGFVDNTKQVLG